MRQKIGRSTRTAATWWIPALALFSLGGSTNHPGAVSPLCQGLELIRSHMPSLGRCWGQVCSPCGAQR